MAVKVAINGFGRIGRLALRLMIENPEFDVVAINDLTDAQTLAHLFKYDSAQGRFNGTIEVKENAFLVNGKEIKVFAQADPANLPWGELGVDVVLECTGFFTKKEKAEAHIQAGAKKVVISAPATGDLKTIVYNVNDNILDGTETVISGASCTTNCLAPMAKALQDNFGIVEGLMTTIHAYTNDQNTLDAPHKKGDLRRARAAAANIIKIDIRMISNIFSLFFLLIGTTSVPVLPVVLSYFCLFLFFYVTLTICIQKLHKFFNTLPQCLSGISVTHQASL